jgi:hypothetical protein
MNFEMDIHVRFVQALANFPLAAFISQYPTVQSLFCEGLPLRLQVEIAKEVLSRGDAKIGKWSNSIQLDSHIANLVPRHHCDHNPFHILDNNKEWGGTSFDCHSD